MGAIPELNVYRFRSLDSWCWETLSGSGFDQLLTIYVDDERRSDLRPARESERVQRPECD